MTVCILSDTHENLPIIRRAVQMIRDIQPELVIHCGDITSPPTLREFKGLPMRFILGNSDSEIEGLNNAAELLGFGPIGKELEITIEEKSFYAHHGHKEYLIDEQAGAQLYDYVLHGHTHQKRDELLGRTRIINPGALFMARVFTFARLEPRTDTLDFIEVPER